MVTLAGTVTVVIRAVTKPALPTVAIAVLPLLHIPPVVASLRLSVVPWHTEVAPCIGPTAPFTVAIAVAKQLPVMKLIVAVPADTPVRIPVGDPTDATLALLLVQVPVPASVNVILEPVHIAALPLMLPALVVTVISLPTPQPVAGMT